MFHHKQNMNQYRSLNIMSSSYVPCSYRSCHVCCIGTEMYLTHNDITRIKSLGYKERFFSFQNEEGFLQLKNKDGKCVFLDEHGCSIYEYRPRGCSFYPLIFNLDLNKGVIDTDCPHASEFKANTQDNVLAKHLRELIVTLLRERETRLKRTFTTP